MSETTEKIAMRMVTKYEKSQGREPRDVSKTRCGYDIKSGKRCIEVKGQSFPRADWIWITPTIVRNLGKNISNYYIYIVYNTKNQPKLKIIDPDVIFKNLQIDTLFKLTGEVINKQGKDIKL